MLGARPATPVRARRSVVLVPLLACLVEGAWIAVVDALFAGASQRPGQGPFTFGLIAMVGWAWARRAPADAERPGLVVIIVAAFLGCAWLALGPLAEDGFPFRIVAEPTAWLGAVAVIRGTAHRTREDDDLVVGSLLQWGIPLLVVPWLVSVGLAVSARSMFVATAFPATLLFVAGGLLALGTSRLEALSAQSGLDWTRNRAWLLLLLGVVGLVVAIAVPAAFLLGEPVGAIVGGLAGPFAAILMPIAALLVLLFTPIFEFLEGLMRDIQPPANQEPVGGGTGPPALPPGAENDPAGFASLIAVIVVVVVAAALLALLLRTARRRTMPTETPDDLREQHEFLLPTLGVRLPRLALPAFRGRPATATGAYLAFLADASKAGGKLPRGAAEGPAAHVERIRGDGFTDPAAGKLVADYALERYALRRLPARETQRAVNRWRRLRDVLRSAPKPPPPREH